MPKTRRIIMHSPLFLLAMSVLVSSCSTRPARQRLIFESPMPDGPARLEIDREKLVLRLGTNAETGAPALTLQVLPEVESILSQAAVPNATTLSARIAAATEPWIGLLFERETLRDGDVLNIRAERREVDMRLRLHIPSTQQAIGIEVSCTPAVPLDVCRVTHSIDIGGLGPEHTFWAERGASESPVAIPSGESVIALVTDTGRLVGLASQIEEDRGIMGRHVHIQRSEDHIRLNIGNDLGQWDDMQAGYRLILTFPSQLEKPPQPPNDAESQSSKPPRERRAGRHVRTLGGRR